MNSKNTPLMRTLNRFSALAVVAFGLSVPLSAMSASVFGADASEGPFPFQRTNTPKKANATVGRYLYVGPAPRFEAEDLELTVSKMGLTLRVKAWVRPELIANYESEMRARYQRIADAFYGNDALTFIRPASVEDLSRFAKSSNDHAWLTKAAPYLGHELNRWLSPTERRDHWNTPNVLNAIYQNLSQSFYQRLGRQFTSDASRAGYVGYLTFVYPIAATTEGPFSQPREAHRSFGIPGNVEARWWSDRWNDEFGGLPFLMINSVGVAFHGPITYKSPFDVAYLRRGFVSHGCHRMDANDLLELRAILPKEIGNLVQNKRGIPLTILNYPDVTDWNGDGKLEVIDVNYYDLDGEGSVASWRRKHLQRYDGQYQGKNRLSADGLTIRGLPKYEIQNGVLKRVGAHGELPFSVFEHAQNRILQYREAGVRLRGHDDAGGMFSPYYFY